MAGDESHKLMGYQRLELLHALALEEVKQRDLATKYNVTEQAISAFKIRHRDRIQKIRDDINNEFAGMWVAEKKNRIAEYEKDIERLNDAMQHEMDPTGLRIKHNALLRVAEEMGQLPTKSQVQIESKQVVYKIEGVDPKELT